jgi:hypothetical protein
MSVGSAYPSLRDDNETTMRNLFAHLWADVERRVPIQSLQLAVRRWGLASILTVSAVAFLMLGAGVSYGVSVAKDDVAYASYVWFTWAWAIVAAVCLAFFIAYLANRHSLRRESAHFQGLLQEAVRVAFECIMERKVSQYSSTSASASAQLAHWLLQWTRECGATQPVITHTSANGIGIESSESVIWLGRSAEVAGSREVENLSQIGATETKAPILVATTYFHSDVLNLADRLGVTLLVLDQYLWRMTAGNALGERVLDHGAIFRSK